MKSMKDNLVWAVMARAKQTSKLVDSIEKVSSVVGFFMRIPMKTDAGKVQMAAALLTASMHVLARTDYNVFDRTKFFSNFANASLLTSEVTPDPSSLHIN